MSCITLLLTLTACTITISPGGIVVGTSIVATTTPGVTPGTKTKPNWGVQTRTSGCRVNGPFPDTACTPGDIFPEATKDKICEPGYARSVRNVSSSTKEKVYAAYGITSRDPGEYEMDHLVSLELGGSNDVSNLFPEAAEPRPGFHEKDKVENYLHDQVCSGAMSLEEVQVQIATDWIGVYNQMPKK
jgi:hypothetical protein